MKFQSSDTVRNMERKLKEFKHQTGTGGKKWTRKNARENIYKIIDSDDDYNKVSIVFDIFIIFAIFLSLIPLMFESGGFLVDTIEITVFLVFFIEYVLRTITSKFKFTDKLDNKISKLEIKKDELIRKRSMELFKIKNIEDTINILGNEKTKTKQNFIRKYDTTHRLIKIIEAHIYKIDRKIHKLDGQYESNSAFTILKRSTTYSRSPQGIIDLIAVIATMPVVPAGFNAIRMLRFTKFFRVLRAFKIAKVDLLFRAIDKQKKVLVTIFSLAAIFILLSAILMFQIEHAAQPDVFTDFFDALYWAVATLTTVGYGDIYPITTLGKAISMLISLTGIAIVALPAGVIASAFTDELQEEDPFRFERIQIKEIHEHVLNTNKNDKS